MRVVVWHCARGEGGGVRAHTLSWCVGKRGGWRGMLREGERGVVRRGVSGWLFEG